jgi:hypothetical protein
MLDFIPDSWASHNRREYTLPMMAATGASPSVRAPLGRPPMFHREIRRLYARGNNFEMVRLAFDVDADVIFAALRMPANWCDGLQDAIDLRLANDASALRYGAPFVAHPWSQAIELPPTSPGENGSTSRAS